HHCSACKLAVVKGEKQAAPPVELRLPIHPYRKWPPLQPRQSQKNRNHISQLSLAAKPPRPQGRHVRGKSHAQQINVVDHSPAVPQSQHVTRVPLSRNQRLDRVLHSSVAEIPQKRIPRPQGQETERRRFARTR